MSRMTKARLSAAAAICLLAGCQSLPPDYYLLKGAPSSSPQQLPSPLQSIGIRPVAVADYLDRSEIVTTSEAARININDQERWGEKLSLMIARTLAADLRAHLGSASVTLLPTDFDIQPSRELILSIERFDADESGNATIAGRWQLVSPKNNEATSGAPFSIVAPVATPGSYDAIVQALSEALDQLAASIARDGR
ncbi:Uncharacterized lipoprotein YmbA [Arboricoccus pini]|uniref:Uncharacterized lipoprotein YmbA n=1 Tax=Arboricoccus pini TaxID=1963835 RepID=A0A212S2X6_9PROT|nr:PqiC family protein [Arboricoccus pini]SNB79362.1 Uncharacterized lipoprotein YmbA [Arboricoccus pini]